ncbi:hypothetical protein CRG98_005885 [Punica granatum]|uniref:Retrovirus-related Pol polyprotein from transposon TNT 1-94-like beta-barrel domain-containing protein n=1 Tax=Punica granatum TaxID=22663 RepID=A0A2I0KYV3_PUNGR|nr:hypothetical protein CRG98_005885 [Punica granatum]
MGNGQSCKIFGIGDVCLETELGCKLLLKKVRHIPELRLNLISTGQKTDTLYRLRAKHNSGQVKLSKSFWGETMRTAVDLINLTSSVALDGDVPQQVWTGKKVSYKHLRVFGKIIRSKDVVFFEDQTIDDLKKLEKTGVGSPHEISIPVSVDVEHPVEEVPGEYEETTTGGEIPQVDDDVTTDDTGSQLQLELADNLPRRSDRIRRPSTRYPPHEYVLLTDGGEPKCYDEAVAREHKEHWLKAMNEEMNSLSENHTYDLVKLPQASLNLEIE